MEINCFYCRIGAWFFKTAKSSFLFPQILQSLESSSGRYTCDISECCDDILTESVSAPLVACTLYTHCTLHRMHCHDRPGSILDQTRLRPPRCRAIELFTAKRSRRVRQPQRRHSGSWLPIVRKGGSWRPTERSEQVFAFVYDGGTDGTRMRVLQRVRA